MDFQGDVAQASGLEMQVVRCGCSAARAVVEDEIACEAACHVQHVGQMAFDALRAVFAVCQCEVFRQDGIRVDKQFIRAEAGSVCLLFRPVCGAEEAGTCGDGRMVHFRSGRADACRVVLEDEPVVECLVLHMGQCLVALRSLLPAGQLPMQVGGGFQSVGGIFPSLPVMADACLEFQCAQAVFVEIVRVDACDVQCRIGVAFPSAAEVDHVIDASDAVTS